MASSTTEQQTVSIQIPEGAIPGDLLTFQVQDNELELLVPVGATEGDVLQIALSDGGTPAHDKEEELVTRVRLTDEKTLMLHHCISEVQDESRPNDSVDADNDDHASPGAAADGTHAMVWPAGLALVSYLSENLGRIRQYRHILELGSGLGVVGLALAALAGSDKNSNKQLNKRTTVVLTDCTTAMPLLQQNVVKNQQLISSKVTVQTRRLHWGQETDEFSFGSYDLIVGSDLLYNTEAIPSLVMTVRRMSPVRILIAVRWRKPELERRFFQDTSDVLDWALIVDNNCPLSWHEYGNPLCAASNEYFWQTMVSVQGTPRPLAEITEEDTANMTCEEHEAWENAHIQIYEGDLVKPRGTKRRRADD